MERDEKQTEITLDQILHRCQDLMTTMQSFLHRSNNEQLDYKDYVDAFASFQGHIHNLMKLVRNNSQLLSQKSVFPIKLLPTEDEVLAASTSGRLTSFNHDSAPTYLRTKYDPEIQQRFDSFQMRANQISLDQSQKQLTSANKISQNVTELIRSNREESENELNRNVFPPSYAQSDTLTLVSALFFGKGLRPGQESSQMSNKLSGGPPSGVSNVPQRPAPGKAGPSIKTNIKGAGQSGHPYNR